MARKRQFKRRERRRRSSSTLKRILIGIAIAVPLLYFAFTKVFFSPFESAEPPFDWLVPRDVDLFARRQSLDSDFTVFPTPLLADRLMRTRGWRELSETAFYKGLTWPRDLEALHGRIQQELAQAPLDPLRDVLGREVSVVGRVPEPGSGEPQFAFMARISNRAKLAVELLAFDAALERAFPGATRTRVEDPDVPGVTWNRLELPETGTVFYARQHDLLVVGRDEALLRDVLRQVRDGPETSLGQSRLWDHLPRDPAAPEEHLSVELMADCRQLVARADPASPSSPSSPQGELGPDALLTTLGKLVDVRLFGEAVARLAVSDGVSLRAHAELTDAGDATPRAGILGGASFVVRERFTELAGLMPADTSALLTMNVELRALLTAIADSLGPDVQQLLNETIKGVARYSPTWKVDNLAGLISYLGRTLENEVSVAIRPLDHEVPVGAQPLPLVAVILHVKDLTMWNGLDEAIVRGHKELGLDSNRMWQQDEGVGQRKWLQVSGLPMQEIAYIVLDRKTAIVATDDDFLREIVSIYTNSRSSLMTRPEVRTMVESFDDARGSVALWGNAEALRHILEPYAAWLAEDRTRVDLVPLRLSLRKELLATGAWSKWQGKEDQMPKEDAAALDAELDRRIEASEKQRREQRVPEAAAAWTDELKWLGLLETAAASLRLGEHDADLQVRATTALGRRLP